MSIWKSPRTVEEIKAMNDNTLGTQLGIEFTDIGADFLAGKMPVDHRTKQPYGIMHGGASCVLAETLGSIAGNCCVDNASHVCVGLTINTNHIRMADKGYVHGKATPVHLGRQNQVWEIKIVDDAGKLVSVTRLTLAVVERRRK